MDLSDPKQKAIYEEGRRSFITNKGTLHCPYPKDSDAAWLFEYGWSQALRASDDSELFRSHRELSLSEKYCDIGTGSRRTDRQINSYAAAKGDYE